MTSISTAPTLPTTGNYRIDPARTTLAFTIKHMFGFGTVHGTIAVHSGELRAGASPADLRVEAVLDVTSFASGNAKRDKDVASAKFLDATASPQMLFRATGAQAVDGAWQLAGTLTVKGVDGPVDLRVDRVDVAGAQVTMHASADIDRYAMGVTQGKGMVGRRLQVDLTAVAVPS